jgi:hypothetical protein
MIYLVLIGCLFLALSSLSLYQILGYYSSINSAAAVQAAAITTGESNFIAQNSNWVFTEAYDLAAVTFAGATIAQVQLFDATYNAVNIPQVYPGIYGAIVPGSNPNIMDLRKQPWPLPQNEQFQAQIANAAGGAEDDYALIWIVPSGSNPWMTAPPTPSIGAPRVYAQIQATTALTERVWSPFVAISFVNTLKGGVYQVNGCYWVVAHCLAYKHSFPKWGYYGPRKVTPGNLVENAYGNVPLKQGADWMGIQGVFNYFEPFQVSFLGTTTEGSATYTGIADMTYLGNAFPAGGVPGG